MPPAPLGSRRNNLPVEVTSFIGRRRELREVKRLLGTTRLLTLTGTGGAGKTRLALRAAADTARVFPDGVWLVSLASIEDPMLVSHAVFNALGLQDRSAQWAVSTLLHYLIDKRLLLILDNCEHVLDSCAVLVGSLLKSCPGVVVLATSRQALGTAGEVRMLVPPLSLPAAGSAVDSGQALSFDAVALLAERASAVLPAFAINKGNAAAILRLCRRLDGIPLALELAAARLDAMSVDQLNKVVDGEMSILSQGNRGADARQQTLEATIGWSYRLLDDQQRLLWARLSVFTGGFDEVAAAKVCSSPDVPSEAIVWLLAALVEKSILRLDLSWGIARYELLETIRQFGRARLREFGGEEETQNRHLDWILELAESADRWDHRQAEVFNRIHLEWPNLWAALDFSLQAGRSSSGIEICRHLRIYWQCRGPIGEGRRILASLLEQTAPDSIARAHCLEATALLAIGQNDYASARSMADETLRIARLLGDSEGAAWSQIYLSSVAWAEGKTDEGVLLAGSALALAKAIESRPLTLDAMANTCAIRLAAGDLDEGVHLCNKVLAMCAETGELWIRGYALGFLAEACWRQGSRTAAEVHAREGAACKHALGDTFGLAFLFDTLALFAADRGAAARAATLLGGAAHLRDLVSAPVFEPFRALHERSLSSAREPLADTAFAAAFERGKAMTIDDAVAYALERKEPRELAPSPSKVSSQPLTRRELEIARLIADGMSTRRVAAKLFISERTVETHVTNMLNKLGLNSRIQLTHWLARLDEPGNT